MGAPGKRVRLRGRIDRIDRLADGGYEVTDYKTGGFWRPSWTGWFGGGRQLQHALYALAAVELLRATDPGARVAASGYYFPTVKGGGERVSRHCVRPSHGAPAAGGQDPGCAGNLPPVRGPVSRAHRNHLFGRR